MAAELSYFPRNMRVTAASRGFCYLRDRATGLSLHLPETQASLFLLLRGVVPLQSHAEALLGTDAAGMQPRLAAKLVNEWADLGILAPAHELRGAVGSPPLEAQPKPTWQSAFACLTAGRPASRDRWRESWSSILDLGSSLHVFDDERNPSPHSRQQPTFAKLFDRPAREAEIMRLSSLLQTDNGVDPEEMLRFLILGESRLNTGLPSSGANRNSALLLSEGSVLISSDDDVLPPLTCFADQDSTLGTGSPALLASPVFDVMYGANLEQLREHLEEVASFNLEAELTRLLGPIQATEIDIKDAPASSLAILRRPDCSIHAVSIGCYGARQYTHPFRTFLSRSDHNDNFLNDQHTFEEMRTNPLVIRHATETTVDTGIAFSTAFFSVDIRHPKLPFFPIGRKQDDIYRLLYRVCFPEQLFASLPVAAFHDPQYKEPFKDEDFESYPMDIGAWTQMLIQRFARRLHHSDGDGRLREMAMSFQELSDLSPEQMRRFLTPLHHAHYQAMINHIQHELELYDGPPWWEDERRHALSVIQREQTGGPAETDEELQEYLHIYRLWGDLLMWWPEIVKAAR